MRLAAEVLPVVSVNALRLVVLLVVGAPLSFEVEHVELLLTGHFMDEQSLDVRVRMGKGAELFVLAGLDVLGAVLCLILGDVVETLDLVVRELARLHITAVVNCAKLNVVRVVGVAPSAVLLAVVVRAQLRVVSLQQLARLDFELFEVQVAAVCFVVNNE